MRYVRGLLGSFVLCCVLQVEANAQQRDAAADQVVREQAVLDVLKRHCATCHGSEAERGGKKASAEFDRVTDLGRVAADAKLVVPGDPENSKLRRVVEKDFMPYEADFGVRPKLSPTEKNIISAWISSLPKSTATRNPISELEVVGYVQRDLASMTEHNAQYARYFSVVNLFNAGISDADMEVARTALFKLLNSLSRKPRPILATSIDKDRTVYRVSIDDLGWTLDLWDGFAKSYPYTVERKTKAEMFARQKANTSVLIMRADWFVFHASRPPAYHTLLGIPKTAKELESDLGLNVSANIERGKALRAGFQDSDVSLNNRLIERHDIETRLGAYWKSYDFRKKPDTSNLFARPLGPGGGKLGFDHAGGEIIFNLKNGFQGYMLVDETGERIDKGPPDVVYDRTSKDGTIINGISCMSCHDKGMKMDAKKGGPLKDEVRTIAERSGAFDGATLRRIRTLYRDGGELERYLKSDQNVFLDALRAAKLDPLMRDSQGREPIISLSDLFEQRVTIRFAAAELGLTEEELTRRMGESSDFRVLREQLQTEGIPREQFTAAFSLLIESLELGHVAKPELQAGKSAISTQAADKKWVAKDCPVCPEMVSIPLGKFMMGGSPDEVKRLFLEQEASARAEAKTIGVGQWWADYKEEKMKRETPQQAVSIESPISMGRFEVTRGQYASFIEATQWPTTRATCSNSPYMNDSSDTLGWKDPGFSQTDDDPVVCVTWHDAEAYTKWLSRISGKRYRLPTEAEWEYAARAGTTTARYWGENPDDACRYENVTDASTAQLLRGRPKFIFFKCRDGYTFTAPVGKFLPNQFGLHDMLGNASEWVNDCFGDEGGVQPLSAMTQSTSRRGATCWQASFRGGSWVVAGQSLRVWERTGNPSRTFSDLGFRVVRED